MGKEEVFEAVEKRDVKFIGLWFADILGRLKSVAISVSELETRVEFRSPDPACNPYLAFSVMLAAGLAGIKNKYELHRKKENLC